MSKKKKELILGCDACRFCKLIKKQFTFWYECSYYKPKGWDFDRDGCPKDIVKEKG